MSDQTPEISLETYAAERGGIDGYDREARHHRPTPTARPRTIQVRAPPATDSASKSAATSRSVDGDLGVWSGMHSLLRWKSWS